MRRILLLLMLVCCLSGCGASTPKMEAQTVSIPRAEPTEETIQEGFDMIRLTVGENAILAELEDNNTARELAALLRDGPISMPASNYGGFEKVCSLGSRLSAKDVQTTTRAGDIMLYNSSQIVIFYGSNSWAYTPLARVQEEDIPRLQAVLSGSEDVVTIELA